MGCLGLLWENNRANNYKILKLVVCVCACQGFVATAACPSGGELNYLGVGDIRLYLFECFNTDSFGC